MRKTFLLLFLAVFWRGFCDFARVMGALRYNIALVVANILFGFSFSAYVSLLQGAVHFEQLFAVQLLFSMLLFTPAAMAHSGFWRLSLDDFGSIFIVALLVIFGWWYLLLIGASYTNPIDASTISTVGPLFTLATSIITHSRSARRGEKIGISVALLGVVAILFERGRALIGAGGEGYGNAIVLLAVAAISINTVLIAPVLRRQGTVVVMGWYYLIGVIIALPLLISQLPTLSSIRLSSAENGELAYLLLLGSALPMYLLYKSSEHLSALHNALYHYIQPIIATIVAVVRGQATIDRTNIVGAVLIFFGMLCVALSTPRDEIVTRE